MASSFGIIVGNLIGICIWIFVIASIVKSVRAKKTKEENGHNTAGGNASAGYGQNKSGPAGGVRPGNTGTQGSFRPQSPSPAAGRPGGYTGTGAAPGKMTQQEKKDMSTTDYLQRKAFEDEQEHIRESLEEERRVRESTGGLPQGERLIEGDIVPAGRRVKVCSYCGAQNLLPENTRGKCTCYFCREIL